MVNSRLRNLIGNSKIISVSNPIAERGDSCTQYLLDDNKVLQVIVYEDSDKVEVAFADNGEVPLRSFYTINWWNKYKEKETGIL